MKKNREEESEETVDEVFDDENYQRAMRDCFIDIDEIINNEIEAYNSKSKKQN